MFCWIFLHEGARGFRKHVVFEFVDGVTEDFEHGEKVVNDRVDERVGEVIRAGFANPAAARADTGAHGIEDILADFFLDGDENVFAQKHADLLAAHAAVFVIVNHVHDDEEMVVVGFHFRALTHVEHVFQRERMEAVFFADRFQHFHVAEPVHVEPPDFAVVELRVRQVGEIFDDALVDRVEVVFDELDDGLLRIALGGQRHESGGAGAGCGKAGSEHEALVLTQRRREAQRCAENFMIHFPALRISARSATLR